ncbi:MAG: HupE/UreJ family protein [Rhodocyclaceae bacterium]|nr:MAG: HupE/UreJ family protein [Rhodocyclaceae bacterium]
MTTGSQRLHSPSDRASFLALPSLRFLYWLRRISVLLAGSMLTLACAMAHDRIGSVSHSIIIVRGDTVSYYLNMSPAIAELVRKEADPNTPDFQDYFSSELSVKTWDSECRLNQIEKASPEPTGHWIVHLQYQCPQIVNDLTIRSTLFLDLDESHTQFARLASPDDPATAMREAVLSASNVTFHIPDVHTGGSASSDRAWSFFKLGIEHLLTGYDHILFLLTVIIAMGLLDTVKAVTAFTVAHSLTMALAFLNLVSLPSSIVEPLIALTIIYVSVENVLATDIRRRWLLTGLFGLVHGLGFVGALKAITVSREELLLSLFSFNVGIEAGQLLVIVISIPALRYLRSRAWDRRFCRAFSQGAALLGAVWLVQRVFF